MEFCYGKFNLFYEFFRKVLKFVILLVKVIRYLFCCVLFEEISCNLVMLFIFFNLEIIMKEVFLKRG